MTDRKYTISDQNGQVVGYLVLRDRAALPMQAGGWQSVTRMQSSHRRLDADAAAAADLVGDWQKVTPVGRLTTGDIRASLFDAAVITGYVTVGAAGVTWYAGWPWWVTPAAGFAAFGWRYLGGMSLARSLLEVVETVTHRGGETPQPEPVKPEPQTVRVEVKSDQGQRWQFADLDVEPVKLQAFARLMLAGENFTERTGRQAGLTQEQVKNLREEFVSRGWAAWRNPDHKQQGVKLTRGGKWVLNGIVDSPLPSPADRALT